MKSTSLEQLQLRLEEAFSTQGIPERITPYSEHGFGQYCQRGKNRLQELVDLAFSENEEPWKEVRSLERKVIDLTKVRGDLVGEKRKKGQRG